MMVMLRKYQEYVVSEVHYREARKIENQLCGVRTAPDWKGLTRRRSSRPPPEAPYPIPPERSSSRPGLVATS